MFVYLIIIIIIIFAVKSEMEDLYCSQGGGCRDGASKFHAGGIGKSEDKPEVLIAKNLWLLDLPQRRVVWRSSVLIALIGAFVALAIIDRQLPSGSSVIMGGIVIFSIIEAWRRYEDYHFNRYGQDYAKRNLYQLAEQMKITVPPDFYQLIPGNRPEDLIGLVKRPPIPTADVDVQHLI